jgi:16S rRNA (uracil1498-N3)-methyltransferase
MSERYYIGEQPSPNVGDTLLLSAGESQHIVKVMRQKIGDGLLLFDGRGGEFEAVINVVKREQVEVRIENVLPLAPRTSRSLTIAAALPKGERQKWMVEKLMELGVSRIVPIAARYAVTKAEPSVITRLARQIIEAAKQCGAKYLPELTQETPLEELAVLTKNELVWFAHPVRDTAIGQQLPGNLKRAERMTVVIGPTGGFSPDEVELAVKAEWLPLDLGPYLLRTETAAIAVAAALVLFPDV